MGKKPTGTARKKVASNRRKRNVETVLSDFVREFEGARGRREGSILFRMIGDGGGDYYVHSTSTGCELSRQSTGRQPQFEVIGDLSKICDILEKRKDGRQQYYVGGMLVRGDLRYLSKVAHEMGFIKERF